MADTVEIDSEWLCEVCAQSLAEAVQREFPDLEKVELGLRPDLPELRNSGFLQIPAKRVEFEDGRVTTVGSFSIAKKSVTVGEFEEFVRSTGYITIAEQQRSAETFRDHCGFSGLAPALRAEIPAQFVAPVDARAFCEHAGCRLPTEAEWLAAAILEEGERELTTSEEFDLLTAPAPTNLIEVCGWDITSTNVGDDILVARNGPVRFLKSFFGDYSG